MEETKTVSSILSNIQKNMIVAKEQQGYGYKYRNDEDILAAVREDLDGAFIITNVEGIEVFGEEKYMRMSATIQYGAEKITSTVLVRELRNAKGMNSTQESGATLTYARRYALQSLLAVGGSDDAVEHAETKSNATSKPVTNPEEQKKAIQRKRMAELKKDLNKEQLESLTEYLDSLCETSWAEEAKTFTIDELSAKIDAAEQYLKGAANE